ncbi:DUF2911 domain-containing protein [Flavilitoribacter nigricans]|uniref:DUF2911 domain-containing protein n=1 Tax=Flavilitoribacter nigricans (strain ATCC 23147 / DSM 23189 / NBRC 102662 / NCIMB 1420 / SS-2) TaxID=1122177 RepID=A0A2D0NDG3_FLAN2|nr:DUF2911 domain-containing protein [Flavilitoribacter nigricans]PHN06551.1 hypothetical protein CRP01_09610 [Flavilitoribacter nigricans DSM 23189 = NBRC 102662]
MRINLIFGVCITSLCFFSCGEPEPSSFVATLGEDTLVIEQFTMLPDRVDAEVLIRTPETRYLKQTLEMDGDGNFTAYHSATFDPAQMDGAALEEQTVSVDGDSLVVTRIRGDEEQSNKFAYDPAILPWIDMVHWPYEVATRHMTKAGQSSSDQLMMAGRNPAVFEIRTIEGDSISIKHPYRGTMYARIDEHGAIQYYDATATTRKLIVRRSGPVDMNALAARFADKPIGSLSGEGESEGTVHGANIKLTFGQPAKRGRELFGGIVPWNERWRTGANRASHFSTDKDLKFGELDVPAGSYTLFSIPTPEGGTLIINKQTGQNGNSYDESRDLGRVPMSITGNDESVELFTIDAVERGEQGILQLKWGEAIFEIPFTVVAE